MEKTKYQLYNKGKEMKYKKKYSKALKWLFFLL